jgi:hypothetical protein
MAEVDKSGVPSLSTLEPGWEHVLPARAAGEDLEGGDAVYLKSDGKYWLADTSDTVKDQVVGYVQEDEVKAGNPVSPYFDIDMHYGDGLTPGARVYLSGSVAGGLADAATGGRPAIGFVHGDGARIRLWAVR